MVSFLAEVKFSSFRPKTMGYITHSLIFGVRKKLIKECHSIELEKRNLMALFSVA